MAKIMYGMNQSLDGYVAADTEGNIGFGAPGEALHRHFNARQRDAALCLYGRKLYETMRYWDAPGEQTPEPWAHEFGKLWRETPKVVVSTTLTEVGPNTRVISKNIDTELKAIKADTAGIIDSGGPTLAGTLTRLGLIDEYWLYIHPLVMGGGLAQFAPGHSFNLRFVSAEALPQDVQLLRYAPA